MAPRRYVPDAHVLTADREMHGAFVRLPAGGRSDESDLFYDVRRGRRRVWGSLLRAIDEAVENGAGLEELLAIPAVLESYVYDRLDERLARSRRSA